MATDTTQFTNVIEGIPFGDTFFSSYGILQTLTDVLEAEPFLSGPSVMTSKDKTLMGSVFEGMPFEDTYFSGYSQLEYATDVLEAEPFLNGPVEINDIDVVDSLVIRTYKDIAITDTLYVNVSQIVIANVTLPPNNPLNPTSATVIQNGSYLYQNASTDPLSQPDAPNLADVDMINVNFPVGPTTLCHCKSLHLNFTYEGGTFSVESEVTLGNIGTSINIAGIPCYIDKTGYVLSSGEVTYHTSGLIGPANMLMPVVYAGYGNEVMSFILPNTLLAYTPLSRVTSAKAIAVALSRLFNFTLRWYVKDAPITDYTPESGTNALEALKLAAARVGAIVRYDWVGGYEVVYPDNTFQSFSIPNCQLVSSAGLGFEKNWNFQLPPNVNPSIAALFDATKKTVPVSYGGTVTGVINPPVQLVGHNTKPMTANDPPTYFQLPVNYQDVYIQHLCKSNAQGLYCTIETSQSIGDSSHVQGQSVPAEVTSEWFLFDLAGHVNTRNIGGLQVPVMILDSNCYPATGTNNDIDNGNFVTSIGVTLQPRPNAGGSSDLVQAKQRETSALLSEAFRYVDVYNAQLHTAFWGLLPKPGMLLGTNAYGTTNFWANSNADTAYPGGFTIGPNNDPNFPTQSPITISGIIKSVDLNFPGGMTLNLVAYRRLLNNIPYRNMNARITV